MENQNSLTMTQNFLLYCIVFIVSTVFWSFGLFVNVEKSVQISPTIINRTMGIYGFPDGVDK